MNFERKLWKVNTKIITGNVASNLIKKMQEEKYEGD